MCHSIELALYFVFNMNSFKAQDCLDVFLVIFLEEHSVLFPILAKM